MRNGLLLAGLLFVLGAFVYWTTPWIIEEECLERCVAGNMISASLGPRREIEKRILLGGSVEGSGKGVSAVAADGKYVDAARVDANGEVELKNAKWGLSIALTPQLKGNEVTWICQGTPGRFLPASCKRD